MRQTIGPIRANPLTREFLLDLAREVVAVGRAHGVALPADYAEQRIPFFDGWPPEMTTSMHHDLQQGKHSSCSGSPAAWSTSVPRSACRRR
jgi:Ketopantoate reductase